MVNVAASAIPCSDMAKQTFICDDENLINATNTRRQEVAQAAAGLLLVLLVYAAPVQTAADRTTDEGCRPMKAA